MNTILVTGAAGFFGTAFLNSLKKIEEDFEVFCVYFGEKGTIQDPRFTWIECDLLDINKQKELIERIKPVWCVHFAWYVPPKEFWHSIKNIEWVYASANLFELFCSQGGKKFLGAGSFAEYDWSVGGFHEDSGVLNPQTLYGQSKKSLFEILKKIRDRWAPQSILLWPRIGYFFGENEPKEKFMSRLVMSTSKGTPLSLMASDTTRPYAHVNHLGEMLVKVLFGVNEDFVFNASTTHSYNLEDIVMAISNELEMSADTISFGSYNPPVSEPKYLKIPMNKLVSKGFCPEDTFFEDLRKFVRNVSGKI